MLGLCLTCDRNLSSGSDSSGGGYDQHFRRGLIVSSGCGSDFSFDSLGRLDRIAAVA